MSEATFGQSTDSGTFTSQIPLMLDSGELLDADRTGPRADATLIASFLAHAPGATWMRLKFDERLTRLAGDPAASNAARIRLTSLADGAAQTLTAERLVEWNYTSAYFNGDAVLIEVLASPGTGNARVFVLAAVTGRPTPVSDRSICGSTDDRELSADPRIARIFSGCTAWLFNDLNSTFLTAGHCIPELSAVASFNLPLSTPDGDIQFPPPIDQYAIDPTSNQALNGGVSADWQYFACFTNTESGLTPHQRQQARFTLASAAPAAADGRAIRVSGHGAVRPPVSPTWNGVQKTHVGPYLGVAGPGPGLPGPSVRYFTDTTGGNSGSAVVDDTTGLVIGIHTHEGCTEAPTSFNQGTAIHAPTLRTALANPRGLCGSGRAPVGGDLFVAGDQANNFGTLNTATGSFGKLSEIRGQPQGLAFDSAAGVFRCADNARMLHAIAPDTGAVISSVALSGVPGMVNGLAFDASAGLLYGVVGATGQLVRIIPTSGDMTAIGAPLGGNLGGLEWDPRSGDLFGLDDAQGGTRLVRIRTSDGTRTVVGALGPAFAAADCNGLSWGGRPYRLYTIDAASDRLLRMDPRTGAATVVGPTLGLFGSMFGLASRISPGSGCPGDFDGTGTVSLQDLFSFLAAWFSGEPNADLDGSGLSDMGDVFQFLEDWFAGNCA